MQGNGRKIQRCSSRKIKYKAMSGEEMAAHYGEKTSMIGSFGVRYFDFIMHKTGADGVNIGCYFRFS
jgi:hypothetical protein